MKSIFSLESIAEIVPEDPIAPFELAEDSALYAESKGEEFDFSQNVQEINTAANTSIELDNVEVALEACVDGIDHHVGSALMLAVEQLSRISGISEKLTMPVFEEYSTAKMKRDVALETISELKALGHRILTYIVNAIAKAVAWFKRIFSKQKLKAKDAIVREGAVKETLRLSYSKKEEPVKTNGFTNQGLVMVLHQNGKIPMGYSLVQAAQAHYKQMKQFDYAFELTSGTVINHLTAALKSIHKTSDEFKAHINECQSEICTSNIRRKASDQSTMGDLTQGFTLYEEGLTFGDRSYYRTGITGAAEVKAGSIVGAVGMRYRGSTEPDLAMTLVPLSLDEIETLSPLIAERARLIQRILEKRDAGDDKLASLRDDILRAQRNKSYDDRAIRRAKILYHVLSMYLSLRTATDVGMMNYDQRVSDALLTYVEKSLA